MIESAFFTERVYREIYADGLEPLVHIGYGPEPGAEHVRLDVLPGVADEVMDHISLRCSDLKIAFGYKV